MILIITHKADFTADFVINKLNNRKSKYKRFNCEDFLDSKHEFRYGSDFTYELLSEHTYNSIWFRRTKLPIIRNLPLEDNANILNEIDSLFKNIYLIVDSKWLSSPFDIYKAENKLYQLKIAKQLGFRIPNTLVSNSQEQILKFYTDNNQDIVIKPLSQTRIQYKDSAALIFTNKITEKIITEITSFDLTPCIFQQNIIKDYEIRVTVVDSKIFAAAVFSQDDKDTEIDWRRKKLAFRKVEIPISVQEKCFNLLNALNLKFGAIDLIKTKDNDYVFLEINPNGQWVWIETQTGLAISDEIINFLEKE